MTLITPILIADAIFQSSTALSLVSPQALFWVQGSFIVIIDNESTLFRCKGKSKKRAVVTFMQENNERSELHDRGVFISI